jgi:transcriptional regulator GlxA family with amidase domain
MAPSSARAGARASDPKADVREDRAMSSPPAHRVAVLALPGVFPFELGIPSRVLGSARDGRGRRLYDIVTCSSDGGDVATNEDFAVRVGHGLAALAEADTVVIPPADAPPPPAAIAALRRLRPGMRLASICTGADVLAEAGLLDGRPATTHWGHADTFRARYPAVRLDPGVLYVDDGDVLSSAGAASGIDMCLHLVRRDHGVAVANRAARACVVPPHRDGGQAQYIDQPVPAPDGASTAATRAWALARLDAPLTLAALAAHAAMSVRTFTRRFRHEVGLSPNRWLTQQRIALARRLLETTDLPVERVAERAGLGTAASLRLHMADAVGVSPTAYRRTFRDVAPGLAQPTTNARSVVLTVPGAAAELWPCRG